MAEKSVEMLHRAMATFAGEDLQTAEVILQADDLIDSCYSRLYNEAVQTVLADPRNIELANYVIWVAHDLERLGDRVTNICERVIHIATGERFERTCAPKESRLFVHEHEC